MTPRSLDRRQRQAARLQGLAVPPGHPELIAAYERQLCAYAHTLDRRHGRRSDRLFFVLDFGAAQGGCSHEPPVSL